MENKNKKPRHLVMEVFCVECERAKERNIFFLYKELYGQKYIPKKKSFTELLDDRCKEIGSE